jgi:hypothetical protein
MPLYLFLLSRDLGANSAPRRARDVETSRRSREERRPIAPLKAPGG